MSVAVIDDPIYMHHCTLSAPPSPPVSSLMEIACMCFEHSTDKAAKLFGNHDATGLDRA